MREFVLLIFRPSRRRVYTQKTLRVDSVLGRVVEVEFLGAGDVHHDIEEGKLASGEGTDHDATRAEAGGAELGEADLLGDVGQPGHGAAGAASAGLVDLRQQGIGGVRDDSGGDAGDDARGESDAHLGGATDGPVVLARCVADLLRGHALDGKLGHCVRDLLEADRAEA
jgi:hypothetical protein